MTEKVEDPDEILRRMDLITEKTVDKGSRKKDGEEYSVFGFQMKPNPDRYDRIDEEDRKGWIDTMDSVFYPDDVISEAWEQMDGTPMYYSPPEIDDFDRYLNRRKDDLKGRLETGDILYEFDNESTSILNDLSKRDNPFFVIMVVDVVGSTDMTMNMHPSAFSAFIHSFIQEVRTLVNKHQGYVLKYTGDGLIAYFAEPNITGKHDNAILCASRIQQLVTDVINPVYNEIGLPQIKWRIGLDTGSPEIFPGAQGTQDLLGTSVSMAAKIESAAEENEILLGEYTERNLHTDWRKSTAEVTHDRKWDYSRDDGLYNIYKLIN